MWAEGCGLRGVGRGGEQKGWAEGCESRGVHSGGQHSPCVRCNRRSSSSPLTLGRAPRRRRPASRRRGRTCGIGAFRGWFLQGFLWAPPLRLVIIVAALAAVSTAFSTEERLSPDGDVTQERLSYPFHYLPAPLLPSHAEEEAPAAIRVQRVGSPGSIIHGPRRCGIHPRHSVVAQPLR